MISRQMVSRLGALMLLSGFVFCIGVQPARADIRPPKPAPESNEPQLLVSTSNEEKAHLKIPRSVLNALANQPAPARSDSGISPSHTVIAGIALSAALAVSGLHFVRRRNGSGRMLLLVAGIGGVGLLAALASADALPSRRPRPAWQTPGAFMTPVTIEVVDGGPVQLSIPSSKAALLTQVPTTKPATPAEK